MDWYQIVFTFFTIIPLFVLYFRYKYSYWRSRGVKGPEPKFPWGNMKDLFGKPWPQTYHTWTKQFGRVFGIYEGLTPSLVVNDATLAKEVLIKKFNYFVDRRPIGGHRMAKLILINRQGDDWRRCRAIMSPTFTASKMKAMFPLMVECYSKFEAEIFKLAQSQSLVNVKETFGKLTSTVVARCAFATEINPFTDPNHPVVKNLIQFFKLGIKPFILFLSPIWFLNLIQFSFPDKQALNYISNLCREVVRQRKASSKFNSNRQYIDLLQLLIDAKADVNGLSQLKDSTGDHEAHHGVEDTLTTSSVFDESNASFDEDEIVANLTLFFAAGYETTSSLLTYSSYLLAKHPDVQDRLYQEVVKVTDGSGDKLTYDSITSITYLDAFICEVLRNFPPLILIERTASRDVLLSNGTKVPKGTIIKIPIYNIQHNPEYFDEPYKFKVERFLPEKRNQIIAGSYLPFSIGPRNCIGMRFALMQAKLTLAKLLLNFKLLPEKTGPDEMSGEGVDELKILPGPFLRFVKGVNVRFEKRTSSWNSSEIRSHLLPVAYLALSSLVIYDQRLAPVGQNMRRGKWY